jgi:DNA-binding NarL/FixJ family response regulator
MDSGRSASEDDTRRISILVAEDNDLYRRGLISVLADRAFAVLGSASLGSDAVRMTAELQPDVVLLDLMLADGDSIPRISEMIEAHPGVKVVVLSSSSDRDSFLRSLRAGGATTVGIAAELYLSVETVRWHIKSILRKLGVRSRADAIACLEELQAV